MVIMVGHGVVHCGCTICIVGGNQPMHGIVAQMAHGFSIIYAFSVYLVVEMDRIH